MMCHRMLCRNLIAMGSLAMVVSGGGVLTAATPESPDANAAEPTFEKHVQPILRDKCYGCHGVEQRKADLNLTTTNSVMQGSESGPIIVPGEAEESLLYEMVHQGLMPPDGKSPLSAAELETIRNWIVSGARFDSLRTAENSQQVTDQNIIPILHLRCTVCHGKYTREAELDLRSRESILKGGKSGPALVPGNVEGSLMINRITVGEMPPRQEMVKVSVKPMSSLELGQLKAWIEQGALASSFSPDVATTETDPLITNAERQFWSFQSPIAAVVPMPQYSERLRHPIDGFILHKVRENNLELSPEADEITLLRRAYFDLLGLPPTPREVDQFLADGNPNAFERIIDRLLASPRYGERWGRHWLDLAGYSDSEGGQHADAVRPHAFRYRDYVIRALNSDKPYDQFLHQQIAGDELADYENSDVLTQEIHDNLVATGFLRMGVDETYANITSFVPDRLEVIDNAMETLGSAVIGLTMKCARCHSHKFDPIPQRDYYRLTAIFKGALDEHDWLKPNAESEGIHTHFGLRYLPYATADEQKSWQALDQVAQHQIDGLRSASKAREEELTKKYREQLLAKLPNRLHDDLRILLDTPPGERDEVQQELAEKYEDMLLFDVDRLKEIDSEFKQFSDRTDAQIKTLEVKTMPPQIRALWERGQPSPTYILIRGNHETPGRLVGPGVPSVLTDGRTPFEVEPVGSGASKTGRRLALAHWLTKDNHPLTARVMVNRIWKHHFGRGIVETLDDFGRAGARPSLPQLLDWLAVDFVQGGWSIKRMHRNIMTSATYRQASQVSPAHLRLDPENRLLSHMPLQRLDAESLRDTLLFISGRLDETPFGPADLLDVREDGLVTSVALPGGWRRSVYVLQRRSQPVTLLANFDLPQMSPNCIQRPISTVAPQALHLLNNRTVHQLAQAFADRVIAEVGSDPDRQMKRVDRIALSRHPSQEEAGVGLVRLSQLSAKWNGQMDQDASRFEAASGDAATRVLGNFCHAMLNSAALLYVD